MQRRHAAGSGPVMFLDRTYGDAVDLLTELRDYLAVPDRATSDGAPAERLMVVLETTRLTAMMTSAVAWLLVRKAVGNGEISLEDACQPEHRLAGGSIAAGEDFATPLPPRLEILHTRCRALYARVARLDELVARDAA